MTKKEMQKALDRLRKRPEAYRKGTRQWTERVKLEQMLDNHLYDKERNDRS